LILANNKFKEAHKQGRVSDVIQDFIRRSGKDKYKLKDIRELLDDLDFYLSDKVWKYGLENGYFPPGEQLKENGPRFYSRDELYAIVSAVIVKDSFRKQVKEILDKYRLLEPHIAVKFLRFFDNSKKINTVRNLTEIPDPTEKIALGFRYYLNQVITQEEFINLASGGEQKLEANYNVALVEEFLNDFQKRLDDFFESEKQRIIKELEFRMVD